MGVFHTDMAHKLDELVLGALNHPFGEKVSDLFNTTTT
jgi:hypothetical protein